jgi:hypothetical protein
MELFDTVNRRFGYEMEVVTFCATEFHLLNRRVCMLLKNAQVLRVQLRLRQQKSILSAPDYFKSSSPVRDCRRCLMKTINKNAQSVVFELFLECCEHDLIV